MTISISRGTLQKKILKEHSLHIIYCYRKWHVTVKTPPFQLLNVSRSFFFFNKDCIFVISSPLFSKHFVTQEKGDTIMLINCCRQDKLETPKAAAWTGILSPTLNCSSSWDLGAATTEDGWSCSYCRAQGSPSAHFLPLQNHGRTEQKC